VIVRWIFGFSSGIPVGDLEHVLEKPRSEGEQFPMNINEQVLRPLLSKQRG